jgi:RHS repeat-associated protein
MATAERRVELRQEVCAPESLLRLEEIVAHVWGELPLLPDYDLNQDDRVDATDARAVLSAVAGHLRTCSQEPQLRFHHQDWLGSALVQTDAAGDVVVLRRYAPFGETLLQVGENEGDGFAGNSRSVGALGLVPMGARFYAPQLGRFISADLAMLRAPEQVIAAPASTGLYTYSRNCPLAFVDRDGESDKSSLVSKAGIRKEYDWLMRSFGHPLQARGFPAAPKLLMPSMAWLNQHTNGLTNTGLYRAPGNARLDPANSTRGELSVSFRTFYMLYHEFGHHVHLSGVIDPRKNYAGQWGQEFVADLYATMMTEVRGRDLAYHDHNAYDHSNYLLNDIADQCNYKLSNCQLVADILYGSNIGWIDAAAPRVVARILADYGDSIAGVTDPQALWARTLELGERLQEVESVRALADQARSRR